MNARLQLAACGVAVLAGFTHAALTAPDPADGGAMCRSVSVETHDAITAADITALLDAGWSGQDDGAERLYAPECFDPDRAAWLIDTASDR